MSKYTFGVRTHSKTFWMKENGRMVAVVQVIGDEINGIFYDDPLTNAQKDALKDWAEKEKFIFPNILVQLGRITSRTNRELYT